MMSVFHFFGIFMDSCSQNRITKLFAVLGALTIQSVLLGQVTSYYPLFTEPGWEESKVAESFFDNQIIRTETTNLLGIDSEGRLVLPIINGFRGGTPIGDTSNADGGDFNEPFDTFTKFDDSVDDTGITQWKTISNSPNVRVTMSDEGRSVSISTTFTTLGIDGTPSDGVMLLRRNATIGEVVSTRYRQILESRTIEVEDGFELKIVDTSTIEHRSVFAGTATVSGLYPGSSPVVVTDPYTALVRVSEIVVTGTTESFSVENGVETPLGDIVDIGSSGTTIEWTVKGIGVVRILTAFGEHLDPILNNSIFNNGSNVVGATTLEDLIGSENITTEQLRVSGGSIVDAADTILTQLNQEIVLWPIPEDREVVMVVADAPSQIAEAAGDAGLSGNDALPLATPHNDRVPNVLKFAFNMNLSKSDTHTLSSGGNSGLPTIDIVGEGQNQTLQLEYIRRKNSGLTYVPEYSTTLAPQSYIAITGPETVTEIDDSFERVRVEIPIDYDSSVSYFGRVRVGY